MRPSQQIVTFLGAILTTSGAFYTNKCTSCEMPSERTLFNPDRVRGNYENRIKYMSTPEKVFEYFANYSDPKSHLFLMRKEDLLRAILPFNFWYRPKFVLEEDDEEKEKKEDDDASNTENEQKSGAFKRVEHEDDEIAIHMLAAEKLISIMTGNKDLSFFRLIDTNGDGLIDFDEFLLMMTLLTTPLDRFETAFRLMGIPCDHSSTASDGSKVDYAVNGEQFARLLTGVMRMSARLNKAVPINPSIDPRGVKNSSSFHTHISHVMGVPTLNAKGELTQNSEPSAFAKILFPSGVKVDLLHWSAFRKLLLNGRCELQALELLVFLDADTVLKLAKSEIPDATQPANESKKQDVAGSENLNVDVKNFKVPATALARTLTSWVGVHEMEQLARKVDRMEDELSAIEDVPLSAILSLLVSLVEREDQLREAARLVCGCEHADIKKEDLTRILHTMALNGKHHSSLFVRGGDGLSNIRTFAPLVDVLFAVFDENKSGTLSEDEFFSKLSKKREQTNLNENAQELHQWFEKVKTCWNRQMSGAPY